MGKHKHSDAVARETCFPRNYPDEGRGHDAPSTPIQGVILAGVHRWGASALDQVVSRPLLPVIGWPIVAHILQWLRKGGVEGVTICANSDTKHLRHWLGAGSAFRMDLDYYVDMTPRGPAGCVHDALLDREAQAYVVVEGAILPQIDLNDLLRKHLESRAVLTVAVVRDRPGESYGREWLKPAGIYVFAPQALADIPTKGYQDIKEKLIPDLYAKGEHIARYVVEHDAILRIIDTASYLSVNQYLIGQMARWGLCPADYERYKLALVHKTARISNHARFIGPVLVEPACVVEDQAIIVGPSILGMGSYVGHHTVVSRSVLWRDCRVYGPARLDRCILTDQARVSAHAVLSNMVCIGDPSGRVPAWLAPSDSSEDSASVKTTDSAWRSGWPGQGKIAQGDAQRFDVPQNLPVNENNPTVPPMASNAKMPWGNRRV